MDSARRVEPSKENLYAAVTYDKPAWERICNDIDRWTRRSAIMPPAVRR